MIDVVTKAVRSRMMAGIRGTNTKPERLLRKLLHREGFRFRLHGAGLPGRPDIVLRKHAVVIFVHGCFWHRHAGCPYAYLPVSNRAFWKNKFASNLKRDAANEKELLRLGWRVLVVWECTFRDTTAKRGLLNKRLCKWMESNQRRGELPRALTAVVSRPRSRSRSKSYG